MASSRSEPWNLVPELTLTPYATIQSMCGIKHRAEIKTNKNKQEKPHESQSNIIFYTNLREITY